ncbi:non-ribosomal peptide synthetase component F/acyl carrier protein, partial [Cytobacillus purgationiresistens]|nr:non-ribosomal peptide synthetase component F/acyl carrier protein [Cytobacillus purgationiresistens]
MKALIVGGEAFPPALLQRLQAYNHLSIYNGYGPTETTVYSSIKNISLDQQVTIGQPIRNTQCYIVDLHNRLQPIDVYGELCIAGSGVSQGYWNQPEMTAEKFVKNPFGPNNMMYRTGDLARWLPDGHIEYAGRMDQQVKMRGYRIELQEIEAQLEKMTSIREAAVALHKDSTGDDYLCGYLVWGNCQAAISLETIKAQLLTKLPGYMVPTQFLMLEELPLTANGKLDRKALPKPDLQALRHEAPRTPTEIGLAQIWSEVLDIERPGIDDDFFTLGGHSLKATIIVGKIKKIFKKHLSLTDFFENSTIRQLSLNLEQLKIDRYEEIQLAAPREAYPLSSSQRRLFVLSQFSEIGTSYNMTGAWKIKGNISLKKLQEALKQVTNKHEILRTSFKMIDGEPVQTIHESVENKIAYQHASEQQLPQLMERFIRPFDLESNPLFRTGLIKTDDHSHVLWFDMHHILSDGTSIRILAKEIMEAYNGQTLSNTQIQYKDYAVWQKNQTSSGTYINNQAFWMNVFKENSTPLELYSDKQRHSVSNYAGSQFSCEINHSLTTKINEFAQKASCSFYMVLLAAYNILLSKYSGQEDIVIGSPVAGRSLVEIQDTIGVFINMLPMRNQPIGSKRFNAFLQEVKDQTLQALEHQDYPFEDLVENLKIPRVANRHPLFDVVLVHQNMDQSVLSFGDHIAYPYDMPHRTAKFDLTLEIIDMPEHTVMNWEYRTSLFTEKTIQRIANQFLHVLEEVVDNPERELASLTLSQKEREELAHFNQTEIPYHLNKTVIELFQNQARQTPGRKAIICNDKYWSYQRLDKETNQLARHLQARGVGPEKIVGIMVEPSADMFLAVLAVLKAGGAYIP